MFCISALVRTYVYMCAHKETGCKGTKKFWNMQIDEEKSAKYFSFARDLACFGEIEWMDSENYNDYKSIIAIIVLGNDFR